MNYFSADYYCPKCETRFNKLVDRDNRPKLVECETAGCDGLAGYTIGAPTPLKASYHDGKFIPGSKQYKESLDIESSMYDVHPDKRGEHKKAIDELRSTKTK